MCSKIVLFWVYQGYEDRLELNACGLGADQRRAQRHPSSPQCREEEQGSPRMVLYTQGLCVSEKVVVISDVMAKLLSR